MSWCDLHLKSDLAVVTLNFKILSGLSLTFKILSGLYLRNFNLLGVITWWGLWMGLVGVHIMV